MKFCIKCGNRLDDADLFCEVCGARQEDEKGAPAAETDSILLKYAGYLDNEALFKVAWAKEKGLVKSDVPDEAERIYQMLALRGHLESMYRYALILLNREDRESAEKWLRLAARQGHVASRNYIEAMLGGTYADYTPTPTAAPVGGASAMPVRNEFADGEVVYSGAEISRQMFHSVVEVLASDGKGVASASGIVVSSNGFVISNAHAVLDSRGNIYQKLKVKMGGVQYEALPVAVGRPADGKTDSVDLALLFVKGLRKANAAPIGDSTDCVSGQKVYLIGNSLGDGICITSGIISDVKRNMPGLS